MSTFENVALRDTNRVSGVVINWTPVKALPGDNMRGSRIVCLCGEPRCPSLDASELVSYTRSLLPGFAVIDPRDEFVRHHLSAPPGRQMGVMTEAGTSYIEARSEIHHGALLISPPDNFRST
ncbi:MAG: hypothetical protein HYY08_02835 [Firmicutes bacterium]|nr:hypothetical protein [Bacillota bacterium]